MTNKRTKSNKSLLTKWNRKMKQTMRGKKQGNKILNKTQKC